VAQSAGQGDFGRIGGRTGGGQPARYLLTGIARCQSCGYALRVQTATARNAAAYFCASANEGLSCPARVSIKLDDADAEVMRQLTTRLGAMEHDDPILDAIAERWRELTMPEGEDERAVLESRLQSVRGRIADLEEARYVRGEFTAADEIVRWETMMARLKAQRDAVIDAVNQLGPAVDFDLDALLDAYQSEERWHAAPLAHRRELLKVAVAKVVIRSARRRHLPAAERVRLVLVGEEQTA
jgi:site-specific DNA recombinase